jgi:hypothetical protein
MLVIVPTVESVYLAHLLLLLMHLLDAIRKDSKHVRDACLAVRLVYHLLDSKKRRARSRE